jgi:hypothetical protein
MLTRAKLLGVTLSFVIAAQAGAWRRSFPTEGLDLRTVGENPYFILKPGYQLTLRDHAKTPTTLVVTVLNDTKTVGAIETRVVEERETKGSELVEISRNYFVIDDKSKDVFYLGEDVDIYKHGKVTSHEGSWHHGTDGAKLGLFVPGAPQVGMRFYQEQAPRVAMDRVEIVSLTELLTTPAGTFKGCLRIKESSPLEPLMRDYKTFAPGVGLIKDGDAVLVSKPTAVRD